MKQVLKKLTRSTLLAITCTLGVVSCANGVIVNAKILQNEQGLKVVLLSDLHKPSFESNWSDKNQMLTMIGEFTRELGPDNVQLVSEDISVVHDGHSVASIEHSRQSSRISNRELPVICVQEAQKLGIRATSSEYRQDIMAAQHICQLIQMMCTNPATSKEQLNDMRNGIIKFCPSVSNLAFGLSLISERLERPSGNEQIDAYLAQMGLQAREMLEPLKEALVEVCREEQKPRDCDFLLGSSVCHFLLRHTNGDYRMNGFLDKLESLGSTIPFIEMATMREIAAASIANERIVFVSAGFEHTLGLASYLEEHCGYHCQYRLDEREKMVDACCKDSQDLRELLSPMSFREILQGKIPNQQAIKQQFSTIYPRMSNTQARLLDMAPGILSEVHEALHTIIANPRT